MFKLPSSQQPFIHEGSSTLTLRNSSGGDSQRKTTLAKSPALARDDDELSRSSDLNLQETIIKVKKHLRQASLLPDIKVTMAEPAL